MVAEPTRPAADEQDPIMPVGQHTPSEHREDPEAPGEAGLAHGQVRQPVEVTPPREAKASAPLPTVTGASAQPHDAEREADEHDAGSRLGRPSLTMLADAPLTDDTQDRLGFPAYADALAGLLDHPETDTPLTIAVSAPW